MFGTLVSTNSDQGSLEYVGNPDPAAAVSRNLRDGIHIACKFCRFRKVRCSGGRKGCQRCLSMGLECVYPENQGRGKRQESKKSRRPTMQRNGSISSRISCNETESQARSYQGKDDMRLALDDLHNLTFNDSCIDESLFTPWIMDTPMQHGLEGSSSSGSSSNAASESSFPLRSRSAAGRVPDQLPDMSTLDASLTSVLSPSNTDSVGDLESWEGSHMARGDMAWATNTDRRGTIDSTSESLSLEPRDSSRAGSDGCCCLLKSMSFIERLASRANSRENRIDVLLTNVRDAIDALAMFLECERCAAQVEQNVLLTMATRQISIIFEKTADCYEALHLSGHSGVSSPQQSTKHDASTGPIDISVSTYRVNQRERLHIIKSLVTVQIAELQQHINTIKSRYRNRPNQGQAEALVEAENNIKLAQVAINSHL